MNGEAARPSGDDATFHAWASGGGAIAACADLLVAVIFGLADPPVRDVLTVRSLALPLAGASLLSFLVCAACWSGTARVYVLAAVVHAGLAGAGGFVGASFQPAFPVPLAACVVLHGVFAALCVAGARAVAGRDPGAVGRSMAGAAGAVAENLESVLVAIVFALVIRHFAVEAYKIPTTSMAPTLLGDDLPRRGGDRVLVKKWDAFLEGPQRWQIWVFRPPLDRTINYVKRVVGLPGETVEIRDGDLYVNGTIARKPPKTREDTWFPVWPRADGAAEKRPGWSGEGFRPGEGGAFVVSGAKDPRMLRYDRKVGDAPSNTGMYEVGDVRLRFEVADPEPGTEFVVRIAGRAGPVEVRIDGDGAGIHWQAGASGVGNAGLSAGPVRDVEVSFADLALEVLVNGKAFRYENLDPAPAGSRAPYGVSFGVEKGGATFRDVRLDRDVFYTESGKFTVPEGHYFFLGDNSSNSQDGRRWQAWEITEVATGRTFYCPTDRGKPSPSTAREGRVEFRDRNGVLRSFEPSEIRVSDSPVPMSFVPAADLHGRAFAIFWPPRWFTTTPGGRLRVLP